MTLLLKIVSRLVVAMGILRISHIMFQHTEASDVDLMCACNDKGHHTPGDHITPGMSKMNPSEHVQQQLV